MPEQTGWQRSAAVHSAVTIRGVLETILYAGDLAGAERFYVGALGLAVVSRNEPVGLTLRAGPGSVLLVFDPAQAEQPGRPVPSHGARGPGHVALRIDASAYDEWLGRLRDAGVAIEHEHEWDGRGRSIYVRDPAGNSVELITADIWPPA